ncbi:hypothetical protein FHG87_017417 [Trinorchestia longiramus]|nr:hypothetical protein FHG87_017417 [Trinorchestia longiramus]
MRDETGGLPTSNPKQNSELFSNPKQISSFTILLTGLSGTPYSDSGNNNSGLDSGGAVDNNSGGDSDFVEHNGSGRDSGGAEGIGAVETVVVQRE